MHHTSLQEHVTTRPLPAISPTLARLAGVAAATVLLLLALLHVLSPEFNPVSRMVSEYANGQSSWVLSLMFIAWAISSWALALAIRSQLTTRAGKIGWWFLMIAGVGEAMAAFFDINHPLHAVASIGLLALPAAAMLISVQLSRTPAWAGARTALLWTANLTWVILLLLIVAVAVMFAGFAQTGGQMTPEVIAVVGVPNRLLIFIYCLWLMTVAWQAPQVGAHNA
ncbi:MAG: DUF998 domain-containing protein [Caldilinea sp. CFX5]|nr:DUF998 domain-containing protein [Caldilinea sp. CFX5]